MRLDRVCIHLLLFALSIAAAQGQPQQPLDGAELRLALKKLGNAGSALYVAAHPDDENTALLAWLANERLVRTAYLCITRGEGGQNLIGSEKGELLGIIRTEELLAARRIDGAEQFFTRAVDFGYSKTAQETLRIWDEEKILSDVVWVIRSFRPDIIISRFPATGEGGHGHHTASAILAGEAFHAAADPTRFPEQLKLVRPWQAKRLVWNSFQRRGGQFEIPPEGVAVDLGKYNPLLGRAYTEIAADSRSMHKSQGFGAAERRGTAINRFQHVAGERANSDLFEGVELSWRRFPGGEQVEQILRRATEQFDPENAHRIVPLLFSAYSAMSALPSEPIVETRRQELLDAIRAAAGLWIEAMAGVPAAAPGAEVKLAATVISRSPLPVKLHAIRSAWGNAVPAAELKENQPHTTELTVRVPDSHPYPHPYWLNGAIPQTMIGLPKNPPELTVSFDGSIGESRLTFEVPVLHRSVDRVRGELYRNFIVAPALTIEMGEPLHVFPANASRRIAVKVRRGAAGRGAIDGTLRLDAPSGWKVSPSSIPFRLPAPEEQVTLAFEVMPPAHQSIGELRPRVEASGLIDRSRISIQYDHIPVQMLFPRAVAQLLRANVRTRGSRIGYVMGPGDEVPVALRQLGYEVTLLSDEELEHGELPGYDAIVTGVRAYNTRPALRAAQKRLLDYVERGGRLVVQYNTVDEALPEQLGPYPLKISRDRVTLEEAPVTLLAPDHPLLSAPNRITAADFVGWVQERGLYFPNAWDERYQPILSMNDPGESEKHGALLYAKHGRGDYIYTSLAWFRQLPAGVPGAYRIFANLVSPGEKQRIEN